MCVDYLYRQCFRRHCRFQHELLTCNQYRAEGNCGRLLTCNYLHLRDSDVASFQVAGTTSQVANLEIKRYVARVRKELKKTGGGFGQQVLCNLCRKPLLADTIVATNCNHLYCTMCSARICEWGWCKVCNARDPVFVNLIVP